MCAAVYAQGDPVESCLVLKNEDGKVLYSLKTAEICDFAICYTHSVALTPVCDYFLIRADKIVLERTEYMDFGAGLPHMPGVGQSMRRENGKIVISGYNMELPAFDLRVGRIAGHRFVAVKKNGALAEIPLSSIASPGEAVTFMIENCRAASLK